MLAYALTLGNEETWWMTSAVWAQRLTHKERGALAFASLHSCDEDVTRLVCEAVFDCSAGGTPTPPFLSPMDDASHWADSADPRYIKACVLAGYNRMPPSEKTAFLDFVLGKSAA